MPCIDEGISSLIQYLDLFWLAQFKHQYGMLFQTDVEPKLAGKKLSASDRRVIVTRLVAEAQKRVWATASGKARAAFTSLGYLPVTDPAVVKPHPVPAYRFSPLTDIELQVQHDVLAHEKATQSHSGEASSSSVMSPDLSSKGKMSQPPISRWFKK